MSKKRSRAGRKQDPSGQKGAEVRGGSAAPPGYTPPKEGGKRRLGKRGDLGVRFEGFTRFPRAFWLWLAVAAILRFVWLNQEGYWADEVYVYNDCLRSLAEKLHTLHFAHFIVGEFFLKYWNSVGALRLMTALWGLLTFPFFFDLAARILGRRGGLLATAFLALSSYHINYSLDANYYAPVIFFSTVGLWFAVRYVDSAHPLDLFLSPASLAAGFLFHPFTGVLAGTTTVILVILLVLEPRHRRFMWPATWWEARREGWALLIALVEVATVLAVAYVAYRRARSLFVTILEWLELGATPRNYRFIPDLFYDYFRGNFADYPLSSRLGLSFGWPAAAVAGVGVAASLRKRPWIAALLFGPLVVSFFLIANLKAQHHFYVRYFSYLFPSLVVFLVWGAEQLGAWKLTQKGEDTERNDEESKVLFLSGGRRGPWIVVGIYLAGIAIALLMKWTEPGFADWIAWILGLGVLAVFLPLGSLRVPDGRGALVTGLIGAFIVVNAATVANRFLVRGGQNWNLVVDFLKENAKPGELIVYEYPQEGEMLRYYLPRIGLSFRDTLKLPEGEPFPYMRTAQLRGMARTDPSFWLIRGWNINTNPQLTDWAKEHLPLPVDAPSNFEPFLDVYLFRGDIVGQYLEAPYGLRLGGKSGGEATGNQNLESVGTRAWERVVDVETPTSVAMRLMNRSALGDGARARPVVDDAAGEWTSGDGIAPAVSVPMGSHRLGIELDQPTGDEAVPDALWTSLDLPAGVTFPATRVSLPFPTFCQQDDYRGRQVLRLFRNLGVQYWFQFPAAGTYEFRIEAVHDKPRPVWLDIAVDDRFQGTLVFERMNNEWGEMTIPIRIPDAGWHSLAVNLVSAGTAQWGLKEDEETNAILGNLSLRRLPGGVSPRDDRARFVRGGTGLPSTGTIPVVDARGVTALPEWTLDIGAPSMKVLHARPVALHQEPVVEVEVPHDSKGINLIAPPLPCPPEGHVVHVEAVLGCFDLVNHSVSLGVAFFNARGEAMRASVAIGQESIYRTTDGHRFVVVKPAPAGAARYAPLVVVYPNGRRPARRSGWIRIGGVAAGED